jgi:hypothetical protein
VEAATEAPTDLEGLLAFLRDFFDRFQGLQDQAHDHLVLQEHSEAHRLFAEKARLLAGLPDQLSPAWEHLTRDERDCVLMWAGYARKSLAEKLGQDGMFTSLYMVSSLGFFPGEKQNYFAELIDRLARRSAPYRLSERHIQALDDLLARHDISVLLPESRARVMVAAGVTHAHETTVVDRGAWAQALASAAGLVDFGLLAGARSPGEFLYRLGFRAPLED